MNLENNIEAILLFKNEPVTITELSKNLGVSKEEIKFALNNLQNFYKDRGIILIILDEKISLGTNPQTSTLIEKLQKEEFSKDLGRAGLETLAIILYKAPVSRREIDYIRGVNSGFIVRNLLVRGLIERSESATGERSFSYKPTLELFRFLGITKKDELPEFNDAYSKIANFVKTIDENENEHS